MLEESSSSEIETSIDSFNEGNIENCLETQYIKNHFTDIKKLALEDLDPYMKPNKQLTKKNMPSNS